MYVMVARHIMEHWTEIVQIKTGKTVGELLTVKKCQEIV